MPDSILYAILYLVGAGLLCYVLWWGLGKIGDLIGDPWRTILMVLLVLVIMFICVNFILALFGQPLWGPALFRWKH